MPKGVQHHLFDDVKSFLTSAVLCWLLASMICDLISENSFPILVILYAFFNPLRDNRSYNFVLEESNIKLNDHSRIFSRNFMTRGTYFEYN